VEAYRFCEDALDIAAGDSQRAGRSDRFLRFEAWENRVARENAPPVIYYALLGEVVKIGTTTRLRDRMNSLKADELLATEPGNSVLEELRHKQFEHLRAPVARQRELFMPGDELVSHIDMLRAEKPSPQRAYAWA
jgi:hypothetical protein